MCRILGKISSNKEAVKYELLEAPHSLLDMSKNANHPGGKRGPHDDGWGISYREDDDTKIRKEGRVAYEDDRFKKLASKIKTVLLMGSARLAPPEIPPTRKNAHPFRKDNLVFVHNGCINEGLERKTKSDTKDYLRWLSERWDSSEDNLVKLLKKASKGWDYTSITFLMSDGKFTVSSGPIDDGEWELIDNETLLIVESPSKVREFSID